MQFDYPKAGELWQVKEKVPPGQYHDLYGGILISRLIEHTTPNGETRLVRMEQELLKKTIVFIVEGPEELAAKGDEPSKFFLEEHTLQPGVNLSFSMTLLVGEKVWNEVKYDLIRWTRDMERLNNNGPK